MIVSVAPAALPMPSARWPADRPMRRRSTSAWWSWRRSSGCSRAPRPTCRAVSNPNVGDAAGQRQVVVDRLRHVGDAEPAPGRRGPARTPRTPCRRRRSSPARRSRARSAPAGSWCSRQSGSAAVVVSHRRVGPRRAQDRPAQDVDARDVGDARAVGRARSRPSMRCSNPSRMPTTSQPELHGLDGGGRDDRVDAGGRAAAAQDPQAPAAVGHCPSFGSRRRPSRPPGCHCPPSSVQRGRTSALRRVVECGPTMADVLAIDAGTTGIRAMVVDEARLGRAPRLPRVPPALPPPGLGRARPRGLVAATLASRARGAGRSRPRAAATWPRSGITNQRETTVAVGPGHPPPDPPGDRVAGPADGRPLRDAARRGVGATGSATGPAWSSTRTSRAPRSPGCWTTSPGPATRRGPGGSRSGPSTPTCWPG